LGLFAISLTAYCSDARWVRVSDGKISVYTQEDPSAAVPLIAGFSRLRSALAQTSIFRVDEGAPLKVIAFHSDKEFNQYRLNAGSCAFFQQTRRSEYVVLEDMAAGHKEVSAHEFIHFVLAHSGVTLPLWMNEGVADFYSTFQISGDRVTFGRSVSGRLPILRSETWLPLEALFQISTSSSYYSDPTRMALFYSESWALAHMLLVSPDYSAHFADFVQAVHQNHDSAESFKMVYNKTPAQVQEDLRGYLDRQHLPVIEMQLTKPLVVTATSQAAVTSAEMDLTLSDLTPNNSQTQAALENRLSNAGTEAEESLGYMALRQGKNADARNHFQKAVERHSADATVYFYLAHLNHEAGAPSSQVIPLLNQALTLKPDLGDARLELALVATGDGNFEQALEALHNLDSLRPENAYTAVYTEAYCDAQLDKFEEATATARHALALTTKERDRSEVAELLNYIHQQTSQ
jgi:tetratricopeptide (TPR) repeat protein